MAKTDKADTKEQKIEKSTKKINKSSLVIYSEKVF